MSKSVWKPTPVVVTIDIQDEDECVIISEQDDDITLTEEEIGNLFFKILPRGIKVMMNDFNPI